MTFAIRTIVEPTEEPITPDDLRDHMGVDTVEQEGLLAASISAVRQQGEVITGRAWCLRTQEMILDSFPKEIRLPGSPVQSITSITYIDEDGTTQTLAASGYQTDLYSEPARIMVAHDEVWPDTQDVYNAVTVRYVCGYASADDVPEGCKQWLKIRAATMYENREALIVGQSMERVPRDFIDGLLDPHVVKWFSYAGG